MNNKVFGITGLLLAVAMLTIIAFGTSCEDITNKTVDTSMDVKPFGDQFRIISKCFHYYIVYDVDTNVEYAVTFVKGGNTFTELVDSTGHPKIYHPVNN